MQAAKTPAERSALMDEHMKLMQSGMAMMGAGNSGGHGYGDDAARGAGQTCRTCSLWKLGHGRRHDGHGTLKWSAAWP